MGRGFIRITITAMLHIGMVSLLALVTCSYAIDKSIYKEGEGEYRTAYVPCITAVHTVLVRAHVA